MHTLNTPARAVAENFPISAEDRSSETLEIVTSYDSNVSWLLRNFRLEA